MEIHNIPPVYGTESKILILGSFPSVRSREQGFYYAHPQNRFWRVLAAVLGMPVPCEVEEKKAMLRTSRIALWDAAASCELRGSSDSSIKNVLPNDLSLISDTAGLRAVFCNGNTARRLYGAAELPGVPVFTLPSTSPANASFTFERLCAEWMKIREYLD